MSVQSLERRIPSLPNPSRPYLWTDTGWSSRPGSKHLAPMSPHSSRYQNRRRTIWVRSLWQFAASQPAAVCKEKGRKSGPAVWLSGSPADDGVESRLLAFPPGSEYELWKIDSVARSPVPARVRLYVHRAQPKIENPNGPCSTMLTVAPDTTMPELLALATQILGIPSGGSPGRGGPRPSASGFGGPGQPPCF